MGARATWANPFATRTIVKVSNSEARSMGSHLRISENARKASRGERGITNRGEFYSRIFSFFFPRHCCGLEFLEKRKKKDRENYVRRNVRENKFLIFKGKPTLHLFGGIDFDRGYTMDSNTRILLLTCGCLSPLVNTHGCLIGRF